MTIIKIMTMMITATILTLRRMKRPTMNKVLFSLKMALNKPRSQIPQRPFEDPPSIDFIRPDPGSRLTLQYSRVDYRSF